MQLQRYQGERIHCNGQMKTRHINKYCRLREDAQNLLETAMQRLGMSARAYARILKLSRTIADLETSADIRPIISPRRSSTGPLTEGSIKYKPGYISCEQAAFRNSYLQQSCE
ncbi:MAG: hypothetical protein ACM3MB_00995 [Acidobacteriota bacterium]